MSDNVSITPGIGANIATDEVTGTGEQVQLFKLAIAADGSRVLVPADATDGLLVNLGANNDVTVAGVATAARQDTGNTALASVLTELQSVLAKLNASIAVTGTFFQATQPVSAASLPLPTGAATLAEQQTQTTALQIIDNLPVAQASTTAGQSGLLAQGAVTTADPAYTTGQTSPLSMDTTGRLRINLPSGLGLATAANQATEITSLQVIDDPVKTYNDAVGPSDKLFLVGGFNTSTLTARFLTFSEGTPGAAETGLVVRNVPTGTQAVSAAALPLPSGASTEATLAALLTELLAKTEPADQQHVILDSGGGTQYEDGATTSPSTGTVVMGVVSEAAHAYVPGELRPVSLTPEGRIRATTVPALVELEFFRVPGSLAFNVPVLAAADDLWTIGTSSPFSH